MTFTEEQKQKFHRYEEIKNKIAELDEEAKNIAPEIIGLIPDAGEVKGSSGVFTVQKRTAWKYSQPTEALEKQLKDAKKEEIAKGLADGEETLVLYYTRSKERSFDKEFN